MGTRSTGSCVIRSLERGFRVRIGAIKKIIGKKKTKINGAVQERAHQNCSLIWHESQNGPSIFTIHTQFQLFGWNHTTYIWIRCGTVEQISLYYQFIVLFLKFKQLIPTVLMCDFHIKLYLKFKFYTFYNFKIKSLLSNG